ncbi:MAG: lyase domain protein repeat-containing protein [Phycisphaerales bacterium]|nr:lyase domain protein repeat-containing protein [Phycisphaerales bacterium]
MFSRRVCVFLLMVVMSSGLVGCMRAESSHSVPGRAETKDVPGVDAAAAVLRDPYSSEEQLLIACDALRDTGSSAQSGMPALYGVLDKGVTVRHRALDALAAVGGEPALEAAKSFAPWYGREAVETKLADLKEARSLGRAGMVKLLEDPKPEARARGARLLAISRTGKPEAIDALMARLNDDNFAARHAAAEAIKSLRPRMNGSAIDAIVDRLDREQIRLAEADAAAKAKSKVEVADETPKLYVWDERAAAAVAVAERIAARERADVEHAAEARQNLNLIERLRSKEPLIRISALNDVSRIGGAAPLWEGVESLTKDSDPRVRRAALEAMAEHAWYAEGDLFEALKSEDGMVLKRAPGAIGNREQSDEYEKKILAIMNHAALDADAGVRRSAALWLARFDPAGPKRPTVFIELMDSDDVKERRLAASVLSRRHDPVEMVVSTWVHALDDSDREVLVAAISWLADLGDDAKGAEPKLRAIVAKSEPVIARPAAILLLRMGREGRSVAITYLVNVLSTGTTEEKDQAIRALAAVGAEAKPAVPALVAMLADAGNDLRIDIARTLGAIGPDAKAALPVLTRMADNRHIDVRTAAVAALAKIDPEGGSLGPALLAAVLNKDRVACGVLAAPMKKLGAPPQVFRRLKDIATDDPDDAVRETARVAAEQLGTEPAEPSSGTHGKEG